jgi:hypothetical protein
MSSEWIVVDGVNSEHVEEVPLLDDEPLLEELLDQLVQEAEDPVMLQKLEAVRAYASWADLVKESGSGPFKASYRTRPEPELELCVPRPERSEAPCPEGDDGAKAWATDKYEKKSRHASFGHTLRAKRSMVGVKATHVIVPKAGTATTELDAMLPVCTDESGAPRTGCLVPLQGPLQYSSAEALAEALGATVVVEKHGATRTRQRSARLEALLAGFHVTELDVPTSEGKTKRYTVCEPQRASGYVKHPKCGAAAGRSSGFLKAGRSAGLLQQELKKERAWREEIKFGLDAALVEA